MFTKPVNVGTLADELQRALDPEAVGRIKGITLFGLLQLLEVEHKSALVLVRSQGQEGRLYFHEGQLWHAHVRDVVGSPAAHEILSWIDPAAEIFYKRRARQRSITEPLQHILMEAARLIDETPAHERRGDGVRVSLDAHARGSSELREDPRFCGCLTAAMDIRGAVGASLVDLESGMTLCESDTSIGMHLEAAAAVATELVKSQLRGMRAVGREGESLHEIIVMLRSEYHLSYLVPGNARFLFLMLDRLDASLGLARHELAAIARQVASVSANDRAGVPPLATPSAPS